jgi:hypothetical protein
MKDETNSSLYAGVVGAQVTFESSIPMKLGEASDPI